MDQDAQPVGLQHSGPAATVLCSTSGGQLILHYSSPTYWTDVAESISSHRFTTGSRINAVTAHAQTFLSCLKQAVLDRLRVRMNVVLFWY